MLLVLAGLPGAGKSAVADGLGDRLRAPVVSVDPIESAILSAGVDAAQPTGLAAYLVAEGMAEAVLRTGVSVVVDAVNAVQPARAQWSALSARVGVPLLFVEVDCSDESVHRARLEARHRGLPGMRELGWADVLRARGEYEEWTGESGAVPRLTVDSMRPVDDLLDEVLRRVAG
ncbi:AAA family ATPase [Microbacteriaceae bacterium 4G12]